MKTITPPSWLFVLPWSLDHVGGVNQVVLNLSREAVRDGRYRPIVLVADWAAVLPVWGEHEGITTVRWRLPSPNSGRRGASRLLGAMRFAYFRRAFLRFCRQQQVGVVNCHYLGATAVSMAAALRGLQIPLIVSVHGADVASALAGSAEELGAMRTVLDGCTAVVAPSADFAAQCRDMMQMAHRPAVVYNGLDAQAFRNQGELPASNLPPTLVSIGKFEHKKGQDVLIRAFAALARERPGLGLRLIGARAESLDGLQGLAETLGCAEQVSFHVDLPHRQVAGQLRSAAAFVLPSRAEPFGIVLLEAGALGVPIVASAVGGIPEIITDGDTGLLVPPDNVEALQHAIRQTLDDPGAAACRALRMRARVESEFSWSRAYQQYLDLASRGVPQGTQGVPRG